MTPKYKLGGVNLSSSVDPEKLSTSVRGVLLSLSAIVIFILGKFFDIELTPQSYTDVVMQISALVGVVATGFGLLQKFVATISRVK